MPSRYRLSCSTAHITARHSLSILLWECPMPMYDLDQIWMSCLLQLALVKEGSSQFLRSHTSVSNMFIPFECGKNNIRVKTSFYCIVCRARSSSSIRVLKLIQWSFCSFLSSNSTIVERQIWLHTSVSSMNVRFECSRNSTGVLIRFYCSVCRVRSFSLMRVSKYFQRFFCSFLFSGSAIFGKLGTKPQMTLHKHRNAHKP